MDHHTPRSPVGGASRKRKFREGDRSSSSHDDTTATGSKNNNNNSDSRQAEAEPSSDNKILAGYLAYEFLRKGTLLGERFGSADPEVMGSMGRRSFEEVAIILKVDGVHIPGIFNPSQLARWIGM